MIPLTAAREESVAAQVTAWSGSLCVLTDGQLAEPFQPRDADAERADVRDGTDKGD